MDLEKNKSIQVQEIAEVGSADSNTWLSNDEEPRSRGYFRDLADGFKRADLSGIDTSSMTDAEIQEHLTTHAPLKRSLQGWQIQMLAIGGAIGSGLFIGSGNAFKKGGPAGVIIGFSVMGIMIFFTMQAAGELAVRFPQNGSFLRYTTRFVDPSWSLAMSWNYLLGGVLTFPLEMISCAITLSYWDDDDNGATRVNKAAWTSLFYSMCIFVNLFGARGFGYAEALLSAIKVCAIAGFCIFGICVTAGARPDKVYGPYVGYGPDSKYIGGYFYHHPGSFADNAKGVFAVLVTAAFAYGGTELSALAAAETANPTRSLSRASKTVAGRILLFYVVSLTLVGFMVPYTDSRLGTTSDGRSSPFVIAINNAHVKALPSIFNVVICLSVLSVGNSSVYSASRAMAAMGAQGFIPRIFAYIDREGRPLVGIAVVAIFGLLCFLAATPKYSEVFNWLLAISGLASVFIWGSICASHIRFRMGMRAQGRSLDELQFKAVWGIWGSFIGLGINVAVVGLQFWVSVWPVHGKPNASDFFQNYLSVPVILAFFVVAKFGIYRDWKTWYIKAGDMDLDSGSREIDFERLKKENLEERERVRNSRWWYRTYYALC